MLRNFFCKIIKMPRTRTILWQIGLVLLIVNLPDALMAQDQETLGNQVAFVNGSPITAAEFEAALAHALLPWTTAGQKPSEDGLRALRKEVLENLIGRHLAFQESLRQGIEVSSYQVDKEMEKVAARLSKAADLEAALQRADLSHHQLRSQLKQDIAIRLLLERQVLNQVQVSDRELRTFYDSHPNLFKIPALVRASHIFIAAGPDTPREKRKQAVTLLRDIQAHIDEGIPFAELAIDYSQCPSSENGGDLGYFEKEKMIKNFADAAFALNPQEVSDIVRTHFGYHLIKVTDRKPKKKLTFEEVHKSLSRNLKFEKAAREIKTYLHALQGDAQITILITL